MNRRELLKSAGAVSLLQFPLNAVAGAQARLVSTAGAVPPREALLVDAGWRFFEGDIPFPKITGHGWTYAAAKAGNAQGAASPGFDDTDWVSVRLPHDFASEQPVEREANVSQGYRRRGIGWYRLALQFPPEDRGRHIELQIE